MTRLDDHVGVRLAGAADPASDSRPASSHVAAYVQMVRLTVTHDELEAGSGMAKGIQQGWPILSFFQPEVLVRKRAGHRRFSPKPKAA